MLSKEQYNACYEIIMNNIVKLRQTYKHINEFVSFETIHYLVELIKTWEFDNKWISENMSEKIKDSDNKDLIREEFYNTLISNISIAKENMDDMCGFYCISTTVNHKIDSDTTIQKLEGRKIIINNDKDIEKVVITFFFIYHMLIVEDLIEDKGITITRNTLMNDFNDDLDVINLCKKCTMKMLVRDINDIDSLDDYSAQRNIPLWFLENAKKYEMQKHYQEQ